MAMSRITGSVIKTTQKLMVLPGAQLAATIYNAGYDEKSDRRATCINDYWHSSLSNLEFWQPLAWPSLAIGAPIGLGLITLVDSFKSSMLAFKTVYNAGLTVDIEKYKIAKSERHPLRIFGPTAWPGLLVGGIVGILGAFVSDTLRSFVSSFASFHNAGLYDQDPIKLNKPDDLGKDSRRWWKIYGVGGLGLLGGTFLGLASAFISDVFRSAGFSFRNVTNYGLDSKEQVEFEDDKRAGFRKFGSGLLGTLIGGVTGFFTNLITDTARSAKLSFRHITNYGLDQSEQIPHQDTRQGFRKFGFGLFGVLIGSIAGLFTNFIIDTIRSAALSFRRVTNYGLAPKEQIQHLDTRQDVRKFGFGIVGMALGVLAGGITAFISDTCQSLTETFRSVFNAGLDDKDSANIPGQTLKDDTRHPGKIYGSGILGVGIGAFTAGIAAFAYDTCRSLATAFRSVFNAGLDKNDRATISGETFENDTRHPAKIYGSGILGVGIGAFAAGISAFAYDTCRSLDATFRSVFNTGLDDNDKANIPGETLENDNRHPAKIYGSGILGIGIGAFIAGIATFAYDTSRSLTAIFRSIFNAGLDKNDSANILGETLENDNRHPVKTYGSGILGVGIGAFTASIATFAYDTCRSLATTFRYVFNAGLNDDNAKIPGESLENDTRHPGKIHGSGMLGVCIGTITASIATLFYDSYRSFAATFRSVFNAGLNDNNAKISGEELDKDPRHVFKKHASGLFGMALGAVTGSIAASAYDTCRSVAATFRSVFNAGLDKNDSANIPGETLEEDKRDAFKKYTSGILGVSIGAATASIATFAYDTCRSLAATFRSVFNAGLNDINAKIPGENLENDTRHPNKTYGSGMLGVGIGAITGGIAAFAYDTGRSLANTFRSVFNAGLDKQDNANIAGENLENDNRHPGKTYVSGILGVGFGVVTGGIATFAYDTGRSLANTFRSVFNAGLDKQDNANISGENLENDNRHPGKTYGSGMLGVGFGAVTGGIATFAYDTCRSLAATFRSVFNAGLSGQDNANISGENLENDNRHPNKTYGSGAFGVGIGAITGGIATFVYDTCRSFTATFRSIFNIGLNDVNANIPGEILENDSRHSGKKYGSGILGVIGAGLISLLAVPIYDTFKSFGSAFTTFYNANAASETYKLPTTDLKNDKRHDAKKYGTGALGALLGSFCGLITGGLVNYIVVDNVLSGVGTFVSIANHSLSKKNQIQLYPSLQADDRHPVRKYGPQSWLGIAIGGLAGVVTALPLEGWKSLSQVGEAYQAISGSILNVAFEAPIYKGLAGLPSSVSPLAKGIGFTLGALTTGIFGALTYLVRNCIQVPMMAIAFALTPATITVKLVKHIASPRFSSSQQHANQQLEQHFKDLYSSLDALGNLTIGLEIEKGKGDGKKSGWSTTRKCFTLNANTPTEVTLDCLLAAARDYILEENENSIFDNPRKLKEVIDSITDEYNQCFNGMSATQKEEACFEIEQVAAFVTDFILGKKTKVERSDNIYRRPRARDLFFGSISSVSIEGDDYYAAASTYNDGPNTYSAEVIVSKNNNSHSTASRIDAGIRRGTTLANQYKANNSNSPSNTSVSGEGYPDPRHRMWRSPSQERKEAKEAATKHSTPPTSPTQRQRRPSDLWHSPPASPKLGRKNPDDHDQPGNTYQPALGMGGKGTR